ncbi:Uncharacterised protein [Vibrio cholerae]|nr:Uncharacterised protein [Vibrio cholerae]
MRFFAQFMHKKSGFHTALIKLPIIEQIKHSVL